MAPDILLFGADGQVGWELRRALAPLGRVTPLTRKEVDMTDAAAVRAAIHAARPAVVANAAAYTAVDRAEAEPGLAHAVNAAAPTAMAEAARELGALLVHYSTDYVHDGAKAGPYVETDAPHPLSAYGGSKLAGDAAVTASGARHLILRTSWVFGARGGNFLKTILRLAREREELAVVADQFGAPTSGELIADVTAHAIAAVLAGRADGGLHHLAAAGETSWHGYAHHVVATAARLGAELRLRPENIRAIPSEDYPLPAPRPKNSRLDTTRLRTAFGLTLPDWQGLVERTVIELLSK